MIEKEAELQVPEVVSEELNNNVETSKELDREPTDEEILAAYIQRLKDSKKRKNPIKNIGKITINPYDSKFKKKRKKINKIAKSSRKANR